MRPPHGLNRVILSLIGLVLVAAAVYGLIRGFNGFGSSRARQPLITPDGVDWLDRNHQWFWPVVAVVSAVVAIAALAWLLTQFHSRPARLNWTVAQDGGTTTIAGEGVASAVHDDLVQLATVERANVRLIGDADEPGLDIRLWVHDDATLPAVLHEITATVTPRLCQALEIDHVPAAVAIDLMPANRRIQ
jgi:hypothetical protein